MIKIVVAVSVLFLSSIAICGELYMWTDKKGVKRFSNTPVTSQSDTRHAKSIGSETNYVAPVPEDGPPSSAGIPAPSRERTAYDLERQGKAIPKATPEARPYQIEWSTPRVRGDELSISGSVSYGESCKLLTVTAFLFDEKGNEKFIRCQASDVGGSGSRILDGKIRISSKYDGTDWRISSHSTRCSR